mmetsp:Transcript_8192/g.15411  ORF Transcript_8192/g.15411 Transcript_8192/m.15411 type:complete len:516 (-) Transcript_8192:1216-2763(-)
MSDSDTSSFEPSDFSQVSSDESDHDDDEVGGEGEGEGEDAGEEGNDQEEPPTRSSSVKHNQQTFTSKKEAIKEIHYCLDHVVALGNQIWQDAKQCNIWMKRIEKNPQPLGFRATPHRDWDQHIQEEVRNPKVAVHVEDTVLYSKMNSVKYLDMYDEYNLKRSRTKKCPVVLFRWPVDYDDLEERQIMQPVDAKAGGESNVDDEWEYYFGDGLDEEDFRRYRSRKRKYSNVECTPSNSHLMKEGEEKELQDLIQRSWDKAVHIASNIFDTNLKPTTATTNKREKSSRDDGKVTDENKSIPQHKEAISDRLIQAQAVLRCKELGIEFDTILVPEYDPYYTCQVCKKRIRYKSNEMVMIHLFGSVTKRGCCWNRIREEQENIVQRVLENEALNIIDNLLQVVFKSLKQRRPSEDPMNWLDVCNSMIETLQNATNIKQLMTSENDLVTQMISSSEYFTQNQRYGQVHGDNLGQYEQVDHSALQTIQIDQDLLPFVLNKDVMKIALSRLVARYDDRLSKY